ncbi:polysaccharide pyruvyl transferase family protein [Enterovibrio paralichthyis]|uniref:polysaccharide pyruvyl transferase family protein n=1 Tax=Enterovibrio paralichthyis TaxID=2853805 RepID=UPI001C48D83F|nr:polysaccharide pyruvyl transferase family protein [Enterovibrio paralichthyis]MBV7298637.1 polysaccharide pyruvyl transferase family protein [Enterovibrio paralichthyis]
MNVFVYGYYGFGNAGDELLLRRVIEYFKARTSDVSFVVRCHDESQTGFENDPVEFVNIDASLTQPNTSKLTGFIKYLRAAAKYMKQSDAFVFGGGTLFQSSGRIPYTLILMTALCVLARIYNVPVYALGVGVGPLKDGLSQRLFTLILRLASDFAVRDLTSMANAKAASGSDKLRLTSDLVFGAGIKEQGAKPLATGTALHIAITIAASDSKLTEQNLNTLSEQLKRLVKEIKEKQPESQISCLTFQDFETATGVRLSDKNMMTKLVGEEALNHVEFCQVPNTIEGALTLVSSFDVVLGMRFHGLVLAAMAQVPFVGVSRDHKVTDLCEKFGFPSWNITQPPETTLFELVERAGKTPVDIDVLETCRSQSDANFDEVEKYLQRRNAK